MNIERLIRKRFNVLIRNDSMPIGSRTGTRLKLADLWGELGYRQGVEIGVMKADFSLEILNRVPTCHLTCIDPWSTYSGRSITAVQQDRNYTITTRRLAPFVESGRATIRKQYSMEAVQEYDDDSLDFVFIDGDHTFDYCCLDLIHWSPKVRTGGMVAVHDYLAMRRGGVVKAVDAYTYCHQISPWFVTREVLPTAFWVKP
jgi:hypothetical protein